MRVPGGTLALPHGAAGKCYARTGVAVVLHIKSVPEPEKDRNRHPAFARHYGARYMNSKWGLRYRHIMVCQSHLRSVVLRRERICAQNN